MADNLGNLVPEFFAPGSLAQPMENLYLNYPLDTPSMVDGVLPQDFPPPFADDGGIDPTTGLETPAGGGNKKVDPNEFYAATLGAQGTLSGGVIYVAAAGQSVVTDGGWQAAALTGNTVSLGPVTHGNVILTGTAAKPIVIDGTVAVDGDVVIQGVIKGKGVILAKGNMYMPASVTYADGKKYLPTDLPGSPSGPRTFGVAQDGTLNEVAYASGGNLMIGDFLAPGGNGNSGKSSSGSNPIVDGTSASAFNFTVSELVNFNRTEWQYTQPLLPGQGQDPSNPATWTVVNPTYKGPGYIPRFYQFGPGDAIPIYNKGSGLYFDPVAGTWRGPETPFSWDMKMISVYDPTDKTVPVPLRPRDGGGQGDGPADHAQRRLARRPGLRERHQRLGELAGAGHALPGRRPDVHQQRDPRQHPPQLEVRGRDERQRLDDLRRPGPARPGHPEQQDAGHFGQLARFAVQDRPDAQLRRPHHRPARYPEPLRGPPAAHALGPDGRPVSGFRGGLNPHKFGRSDFR